MSPLFNIWHSIQHTLFPWLENELEQVPSPIIAANPRRGEKKGMDPAQAARFRNRSTVERINSNLTDNYGGRFVRVRGAAKVMTHLMFGLIAITATQLFRLLE